MGRRSPIGGEQALALDPGGLCPWLSDAERLCRIPLQDHQLLRRGERPRHPLGRSEDRHRLENRRCAHVFRQGPAPAAAGGR
jgi:hypothetical protein